MSPTAVLRGEQAVSRRGAVGTQCWLLRGEALTGAGLDWGYCACAGMVSSEAGLGGPRVFQTLWVGAEQVGSGEACLSTKSRMGRYVVCGLSVDFFTDRRETDDCHLPPECMDVRAGLQGKLSTKELMLLNCGVGEDS